MFAFRFIHSFFYTSGEFPEWVSVVLNVNILNDGPASSIQICHLITNTNYDIGRAIWFASSKMKYYENPLRELVMCSDPWHPTLYLELILAYMCIIFNVYFCQYLGFALVDDSLPTDDNPSVTKWNLWLTDSLGMLLGCSLTTGNYLCLHLL